ncbi:hypothetical protein BZA05DRAFT_245387 [Tricharina praecox]|uniref:uncharacterized protein n=1 Tax=Tricharina praecox TaxID=43433 RepID=UPI002220B828|nr:uncharacterized protein BZA05DRAFT_245387 [Tricharina praecox]KAI5854586.1 hypothetical protein BZA05DRAFT_245387 [Tricharina praecox]
MRTRCSIVWFPLRGLPALRFVQHSIARLLLVGCSSNPCIEHAKLRAEGRGREACAPCATSHSVVRSFARCSFVRSETPVLPCQPVILPPTTYTPSQPALLLVPAHTLQPHRPTPYSNDKRHPQQPHSPAPRP